MKAKQIRFFTAQDNAEKAPIKNKTKPAKPLKLEGYISTTGKLVFPKKTMDQLGLPTDSVRFQIGTQLGQRKLKVLYLAPTQDPQAETFALGKGAKSFSISLSYILQKGGVDYRFTNYTFTLFPFDYQEGVRGYELKLHDPRPKPAYQGKPRGRQAKSVS